MCWHKESLLTGGCRGGATLPPLSLSGAEGSDRQTGGLSCSTVRTKHSTSQQFLASSARCGLERSLCSCRFLRVMVAAAPSPEETVLSKSDAVRACERAGARACDGDY